MWFHVVGIYALKQRFGRMKKADMISDMISDILWMKSWLVGCFGFNGPLSVATECSVSTSHKTSTQESRTKFVKKKL